MTTQRFGRRARQRGFLLNPFRFGAPGGGSDPHFASVKLLLHFDGADGSTTMTDSSPVGRTVTAAGNAQLDTAQFKYGVASVLFDGANDYLTVGASDDWSFGTGNFTVEFWVRAASAAASAELISNRISSDNNNFWYIRLNTDRCISVVALSGGATAVNIKSQYPLSLNSWAHVAVVRNGGAVKIWINGVSSDTVNTSPTTSVWPANGAPLYVGVAHDGLVNDYSGHLDEVRITKGVARYTATFTPPAAAFPNF